VRDLIDNPRSSPEERWLYQIIINAIDGDEHQPAQRRFEVITGGAA